MRYPDQPTLLGSLKPAAKEILPMLAVAFTGLVVLVSCFALFMAPAGMKPHDIAIGVKLMIFIFCLVTPVMYMGTLSEVYYRETPMRKEARERAMLARLKEKYEP